MRVRIVQAALLIISISATFACHGTLLVSGIREDEKRIILQEHNKLRQIVATGRYPGQPGAANMREMVWDDELAARAQQWANNCEFRHDPQRTINRFTMGQNLAIIWSTAPLSGHDGDFPSRIQSWFNEVQQYRFGDAWSPATGHYSQLIWGETNLVGCGFSEYKDSAKYNKLYVCNYGPGGNVVGYSPYQVGKPSCGTYGLSASPRYQGLCSTAYAAAPGYTSNTIDTYEYSQSPNKQTSYSPVFPQPSAPSPTPSNPIQAVSLHTSPTSTATGVKGASGVSGTSGFTASHGSRLSYTTTASQQARRPAAPQFGISVPVLWITSTQSPYYKAEDGEEQQQQREENNEQTSDKVESLYRPVKTTPLPVRRSWNLLTWRG